MQRRGDSLSKDCFRWYVSRTLFSFTHRVATVDIQQSNHQYSRNVRQTNNGFLGNPDMQDKDNNLVNIYKKYSSVK